MSCLLRDFLLHEGIPHLAGPQKIKATQDLKHPEDQNNQMTQAQSSRRLQQPYTTRCKTREVHRRLEDQKHPADQNTRRSKQSRLVRAQLITCSFSAQQTSSGVCSTLRSCWQPGVQVVTLSGDELLLNGISTNGIGTWQGACDHLY